MQGELGGLGQFFMWKQAFALAIFSIDARLTIIFRVPTVVISLAMLLLKCRKKIACSQRRRCPKFEYNHPDPTLGNEHKIKVEQQQGQGHSLHHHQHFHVLASPITFGPHNSPFTHAYQHSKDRERSENLIFGLVWMLYSASLMHHFRPYAADDPQNENRLRRKST
ncbi:hypothetical protein B0J14DRAFT_684240 [Halenospora varia]|nr:hypothetical protein B0J14DRAFT_684240 [Halenospora varia]